jgi:hypothetical protein
MFRGFVLALLLLASSALAGQTGYLFLETKPATARFTVDAADTTFFQTPILCKLAPGKHRIRLEAPGHRRQTIEVVIKSDEITRHSVSLDETFRPPSNEDGTVNDPDGTGKISFLSDRKTQIFIDGKPQETAGPATIAGIEPGWHDISLVHDTTTFRTRITVQEGKAAVVEVAFDESAPLVGIVRPRYRTRIFVTVDLPECRYKLEADPDSESNCKIKGVDPHIVISLPDSSIEIDRSVFLQHMELARNASVTKEVTYTDTTLVYNLEAPVEQGVAFTFKLRASASRGYRTLASLKPITKRFAVPARFNEGDDITVHATVNESGDVIFRYW